MANVAGQGTTFNLPNFTGELFFLTPADNPFTSMIGGLSGGKATTSKDWEWQTADNAAAAQDTKLEGADATFSSRDRVSVNNVTQIHQEGFELSYTKQAATGNLDGLTIIGNQPVQDERAFQGRLKLEKIIRDVEWSFLQGTYQKPADNATARQTRGMQNAITTNAVAAGATALSKDHIDELLRTMYGNDAPFRNLVAFCNAFQKQRFSDIYGYAPESRNVGGLNINQIETSVAGRIGIVLDRHMPTDEVYIIDVSVCMPVILRIPRKGFLFSEPLDKTGSADKFQMYGEIGLQYGPEQWHGKITGLTTS